jgi:hypothetical protein
MGNEAGTAFVSQWIFEAFGGLCLHGQQETFMRALTVDASAPITWFVASGIGVAQSRSRLYRCKKVVLALTASAIDVLDQRID